MALFGGFRRKREGEEKETDVELPEGEQGDQLDEAASLYRTIHFNAVPAGDDVLLHDPERAAPAIVPAFELDLLAQCTPFASIESHAAAAARRTGLPADGVAERLYDLVDRGLLVNRKEVLDKARSTAETHGENPVLDRVAVITSDRPASLDMCLRSYRERYGNDLELLVFDDSVDSATREANRTVARKVGGRILYAGPEEKNRVVAELSARSGVDEDVVRTALINSGEHSYRCGANRNAVLFEAAGGAILMVDDDTSARAAQPTDAEQGLRFSSEYDPWSLRFFPAVPTAIDAAVWTDIDLLAWHRQFLGRTIQACTFEATVGAGPFESDPQASSVDLDKADGALIAALSRGRGRVAATSAGIAGDSGMGLPLYFLSLRGAARANFLEDYESNRATRAVHRCANMATISSSQIFMGAHVALDARGTIPPFPPVLRNSDGVFGALLRATAPESYTAFLPCLVEHTPPDVRPADFDRVIRSIADVRVNDIIRDLAKSFEPAPGVGDPSIRLRAFGQYLIALGALPAADFDALIRYHITTSLGLRIDRLRRALNQNDGQPEQWAADCEMAIAEGIRALTEDTLVIADISASPDDGFRSFQRLLGRFGSLVDAWPTLLEAAAGVRIAEPLH